MFNFTPQQLYPEKVLLQHVCILLEGVFIHLICIIMFKEQEKRNVPETHTVRTRVLSFVYSYKCTQEGLPT